MQRLSVDYLYDITPRILTGIVGATCHARCVILPELADEAPVVEAVFLPQRGIAAVHPTVAEREQAFCDEEYTSGSLADDLQERWQHKIVNGCIDARLHACVHSFGPDDAALALLEWTSYARYPHVAMLAEGLAECVVEEIGDAYRHEAGLVAVDPRLLEASPIQRRFRAQAQMLREICTEVAHALGTTVRQELFALAADGSGQLAVWRLTMRWSAARLFGDARVLAKPGAILDLRRSLERSLLGLRAAWIDVDGGDGKADHEVGSMWASAAVRDFADTARRIHAGVEGFPDVTTLVAQLAAGAGGAKPEASDGIDAERLPLDEPAPPDDAGRADR